LSTLRDEIRQDIERYNSGRAISAVATVKALYAHPSFLGVLWYRLGHALWVRRSHPVAYVLLTLNRSLYPLIRMYSGLELSPRAQIGPGLYVGHFGPTVINAATVAGRNLTVMQGVTIGSHDNEVPKIGDDVSIGTGAIVIGAITVGDHATIAAGAVVVKDVQAGQTVAGVPAKPVGQSSCPVPAEER
jgi:serine O-acetyltransferase